MTDSNNNVSFSLSFNLKGLDANAKRIDSCDISMSGEVSPDYVEMVTNQFNDFVKVIDSTDWSRRLANKLVDLLEKPEVADVQTANAKSDVSQFSHNQLFNANMIDRLKDGHQLKSDKGDFAYISSDGTVVYRDDTYDMETFLQISELERLIWKG